MNVRFVLVLLAVAGFAFCQQPPKKSPPPKGPAKPAPGSLEETLEKVLRNSADIKAAEAKVRDAEAEANRVRAQVMAKATSLHANLRVARRMLDVAESLFAQTKAGLERGTIPQTEFLAAQSAMEKARGEVELIETELKSLRGEFAVKTAAIDPTGRLLIAGSSDNAVRYWDINTGELFDKWKLEHIWKVDWDGPFVAKSNVPAVQPTMAERIRKLLDTQISPFAPSNNLNEVMLEVIEQAKSDVPFRVLKGTAKVNDIDMPSTTGKIPVGAFLQSIEDSVSGLRIVVREYGLLLTTDDRMPDGAIRVVDFWKTKETKKSEPPAAKK